MIAVYYHTPWQQNLLPLPEALRYFTHLLNKGNIIYQQDSEGNVIGFLEFYKINYDQFRKLAENKSFPVLEENISDGPICWVSDLWIDEKYRLNSVGKNLKARLFNAAKSCEYFAGREQGLNKISIRLNKRRWENGTN